MTREDLGRMDERDLMIAVYTKLDGIENTAKDHEARIRDLEKSRNTQTGFFQGANWLKNLLMAGGGGAVAMLFGDKLPR